MLHDIRRERVAHGLVGLRGDREQDEADRGSAAISSWTHAETPPVT